MDTGEAWADRAARCGQLGFSDEVRWLPPTHLTPDLVISLLPRLTGREGAKRGMVSAGFRMMTDNKGPPVSPGGSGHPVMVTDREPTKNAACWASQFLCTHICYRKQAVRSQRPGGGGVQDSKDSRLFWQWTILRAWGLCGGRTVLTLDTWVSLWPSGGAGTSL